MEKGWIKLHRSVMDHWVFKNAEYYKAWSTIIMTVNHSDSKVLIKSTLYDCKRGQSLNSLNTWCEAFGGNWSMQKVRTFFKLLREDGMINIEGDRNTTKLTVCNYDTYNDQQQTTNTQLTHSQHTANTQLTTNKNDKNVNNDKNICVFNTREGFENAVRPLFANYDAMDQYALFCEYWCAVSEFDDLMRWQKDEFFKSQLTLKVTSWIDKNKIKGGKSKVSKSMKYGDENMDDRIEEFKNRTGFY